MMLAESGLEFAVQPKMFGSPDFLVCGVIAVFCDGDFWHGYDYEKKRRPAGRYWRDKIENNMRRDRKVSRRLRRDGYSVLRFWEHDIEKRPAACMGRITRFLKNR